MLVNAFLVILHSVKFCFLSSFAFWIVLSSVDFFNIKFFRKFFLEYHQTCGARDRVVKSRFLITRSSHRCVWCGLEPSTGHVRQAEFCLRVCQVVFLRVLPF